MSAPTPVCYVVLHRPGPHWIPGLDFREQPRISEHVAHYQRWDEQGHLALGGPFLMTDAGGMMIAAQELSREEVEAYALQDPAVQSGLLACEVRAWYVPMGSSRPGIGRTP